MIKRHELMEMLKRIEPTAWCKSDFRKLADGRVARFVDWKVCK
jgi:hypothetical protein